MVVLLLLLKTSIIILKRKTSVELVDFISDAKMKNVYSYVAYTAGAISLQNNFTVLQITKGKYYTGKDSSVG